MHNVQCTMYNEEPQRGNCIAARLMGWFCALFCIVLGFGLFADASADEIGKLNRKANRLYSQGKYEEALKLYEEALLLAPSNNRLRMNRGSALYRLNNLDEAESSYLGSLSQTDKSTLADAHYNLGNILYRQGERLEASGDPSAHGKFSQALENYIQTLKLRPSDNDAKWNLQLAHQKVERLENQQCPLQNDNNNDDKNDKDDKQQGGGQNEKDDKNDKQDQNQNNENDKNDDKNRQERNNEKSQEQKERDMREEEARRLIELYADDADTLSRPQFNRTKVRQPERDW